MRDLLRLMVAFAAAVMVSSCGSGGSDDGGGGGGGGILADLQGTWIFCESTGISSNRSVLVITGTNFTSTVTDYDSGACDGSGTPTPVSSAAGTFTLGPTVSTTLNGSPVTAYQIDSTQSSGYRFYSLIYVDTGTTPHRQYFGDTSGVNDGSTAALRPTILSGSYFWVKQ